MIVKKGNGWALIPLVVFSVVYLGGGIIFNNFYKLPMIIPFIIASIVALSMNKKVKFDEKLAAFCSGAGESNIILMCIIFILAGAFAGMAKGMGAVESTVNLGLSIMPAKVMVVGIFIIACFISISIGTSMGTIAALTPMAVEVSSKTGLAIALLVGAVVGGAMFGDNLSMISDTTIAASRTQGCNLKDKFKTNFLIVLPAAIITVILLALVSGNTEAVINKGQYSYSFIKVIPYLFVLISAIAGMNVLLVLTSGTVLAGVIGVVTNSITVEGALAAVGQGISSMSEILMISLVVGGLVEVIKLNGGIDFILSFVKRRIKSKKSAEFGIAALVSLVDICTANNTIAIVTAGPLVKEIGEEYDIKPGRRAGIIDMFSCVFQGIIPYGAQLLSAGALAGISPFAIMKFLYYPYLMGICAILAIVFEYPKFTTENKVEKLSNSSFK